MIVKMSVRGHEPPRKSHRAVGWNAAIGRAASPYHGKINCLKGYRIKMVFYILRPWGHMTREGVRASAPKYPLNLPDLPHLVTVTLTEAARAMCIEKRWCVSIETSKQWVCDNDLQGVDITLVTTDEKE